MMTEIVLPEDTNPRGSIFGGRVLALVDKCAAVAAMRHARSEVLTVSMDSVEFHNAVRVGDVLVLEGRLNAAFRSSMEIEVEVRSEDRASGARKLTTRAYVTMVAVDTDGHPIPVPPLSDRSAEDRARSEQAGRRRAARLAARSERTAGG
jgi:acyl-CoA hydrolase